MVASERICVVLEVRTSVEELSVVVPVEAMFVVVALKLLTAEEMVVVADELIFVVVELIFVVAPPPRPKVEVETRS